jgi:SAM-dependent methyltransferase
MSSALANTSFDKYAAYGMAVQVPKNEARFLRLLYRNLNGSEPQVLREDFCGTFAICCEWAKLGAEKRAVGLDIDPEPLAYGAKHYLPKLTAPQRKRVKTLERDVLARNLIKADVVCALNFSYFAFHARDTLVRYFRSARRSLNENGLFVVDTFGGPQHGEPSVDTKRIPGMTYYFEQEHFDPINNRTRFSIHFKQNRAQRRKRAFTYDWRMWSIPEIRDAMLDAGFSEVEVYWEGTARDGRGSGRFTRKERGEPCQVWVAYVVGRK